jgi:hypothetical protein
MRNQIGILALALLLGAAGPALAANVIRYQAVLTDPSKCGSLEAGDNIITHGYAKVADIGSGYKVARGDRLVYDVLIPNESTLNAGAVDLFPIDGGPGPLRESFARDQYGAYASPTTDYSKVKDKDGKPVFERGKWLHRDIALTSDDAVGGDFLDATVHAWVIAFDEHDPYHLADVCPIDKANPNVIFFIRSVSFVGADGQLKKALYSGEAKFSDGQQMITGTNGGINLPDTVASVSLSIVPDPAP